MKRIFEQTMIRMIRCSLFNNSRIFIKYLTFVGFFDFFFVNSSKNSVIVFVQMKISCGMNDNPTSTHVIVAQKSF